MGNSKNLSNICRLKYHYVYQTKNLLNGKTYIGRHSTNKLNDGYIGSGTLLRRSIRKYGKENFVCTILSFFDSYEESVEEEKWLVHRDYCKSENNYNIVEGGSNPVMYGEMNPNWNGGFRKKRKYIKKGLPDFSKELNPFYGKSHSKESIEKMLNTKKLNNDLVSIEVDGVVFDTIKQCKTYFNVSYDYIMNRCALDSFPNWICLNEERLNKYKDYKIVKSNKRKAMKKGSDEWIGDLITI